MTQINFFESPVCPGLIHIIHLCLLTFDLQIWLLALSVCFTFTVTIGTFPAITADVKSTLSDGGSWGQFTPAHVAGASFTQPLPNFMADLYRAVLHTCHLFPALQPV